METQGNHEGSIFLIQKNIQGLLNDVLTEVSDFTQSNQMKIKSFSSLSFIIRICGKSIQPEYFNKQGGILQHIYHYINSTETVNLQCDNCAQVIGASTDQSILIPIILKSIHEIESNSTYEPLLVRIKFFANYLSTISSILPENANLIINCLSNLNIFSISDDKFMAKILYFLFKIYQALVLSLKDSCMKFHENLFFPLLVLSSLPETLQIRNEVLSTITYLAKCCNFVNVEELYSLEIGNVLAKFNETYKLWKRNSPDRFAFDLYVRLAGGALEKHWTEVLMIISQSCESEKDIEMRMDMILLMDALVRTKVLKEQLGNYIEFILPEILFPATAWRTGRPNYKVRKAAMVTLIAVFDNDLIQPETALNYFKDFQTTLKSTLEDDWDAELRYAALNLLKQIFIKTFNGMKYDHMSEIYSMILKRLDDSQDNIRMLTCDVLIIFLGIGRRLNISDSIYEYMISNSFIHLDDPKEEVREKVGQYLHEAVSIHPKTFRSICEKNENSFMHKSLLFELKSYAESLIK